MIRAVISDFGGVLTTPLSGALTAYGESSGISPEQIGTAMERLARAHGRHPLFELEKGAISERRYVEMLEAELGRSVDFQAFSGVLMDNLHRNEAMIDLVRDLRRRGLRTALLTNNVREWESLWRAKLPDIDELFEVIVDSAFVGMRKPEPEIYRLTLERLGGGLEAHECVFVDDLEINCKAACALGMHAVRFVDSEQAIEAIEAAVREREVDGDTDSSA